MIEDGDDISFGGAKEKAIGKVIGAGIRTAAKEFGPGAGAAGAGSSIPEDAVDSAAEAASETAEAAGGLIEAAGDILKGIWEGIFGAD